MRTILGGMLAACSLAHAQSNPGWTIEIIGGPVSPSNPQVTVRVSAYFTPPFPTSAYGFGGFDLETSDPFGAFSGMAFGSGLAKGVCHGGTLGTPTGTGGVAGVVAGQVNVLGCQANPFNPIEVWEATWSTSVFTPRSVLISTTQLTGIGLFSGHGEPFPDIFFEPKDVIPGSAVIQVIPAPGAFVVLLSGAALTTKRRR